MNNPQIIELTEVLQNAKNPLVQRHLAFKIEELERGLRRGFAQPVTLRTWLLTGNGVESVPSRSSHASVNPQRCLTDPMKSIFGGVMKDFGALLFDKKSHGRISLDTIVVCKGTGKLINSLDLDRNADTSRADFEAIVAVLEEIVGRHFLPENYDAFPADVVHFMEIISREELPTGALQAFVLNHPAFWSGTEIVRNVIALRSSYYLCGTSTRNEFEEATRKIPHEITVNWQFKVQQSPNYRVVLARCPEFIEPTDGLRLMAFHRIAFLHPHGELILSTQKEIGNELYAMFPDFLAYFIEKTYDLAMVREICGK